MNKEISKAQREYDLNKAAQLQYGELPQLQKQLEEEEEKVREKELSLVHEAVTDEEIEAELKKVQEQNAREITVDRPAENGDTVAVSYTHLTLPTIA